MPEKNDIKTFLGEIIVIKDIEGNEYKFSSKISIKKENEICKIISDFLKHITAEARKAENQGVDNVENIYDLLKDIPSFYIKVAEQILGLPADVISEKFDLQTLKESIDPFLQKYLKILTIPILGTNVVLENSLHSSPTTADGMSTQQSNTQKTN